MWVEFGRCLSILIDFQVDVGRFFVAEGRACRGQVKNVECPKIFSRIEDSIREHRVWKSVYSLAKIAKSALTCAHVHFLLVTPHIIGCTLDLLWASFVCKG